MEVVTIVFFFILNWVFSALRPALLVRSVSSKLVIHTDRGQEVFNEKK